ncbi:MAG: sugar ABC transporter permease [Chloroflexota bacterium]
MTRSAAAIEPTRTGDTFTKPGLIDALIAVLPAIFLAVLGAYLNANGILGGPDGWLGGKEGLLGGVKGVLGGLLIGSIGFFVGFFVGLLILSVLSRGKRQRFWRRSLVAYTYLSPSVLILLLFTFISMIYALYISLHEFGIGQMAGKKDPIFVGLGNYAQAIWEPGTRFAEFWKSLITTLWLTFGSIPFQIVLALVVAVLLFRKMRGVGFYRTSFFLPYVTATIALAEVWVFIFSRGEAGIINNILVNILGMSPQNWLVEHRGIFEIIADGLGATMVAPAWMPDWAHSLFLGPSQALVVMMMYSVWKYFGFSLVILLAGLGNIDPELYEAAQIDGANPMQSFWRITIPLLSPSLYYVTLISTMGSLRSFDVIYQLSIRASAGSGPGGPLDTTQSLIIYVFNQFWRDHFFGFASALAIILFVVILIVTLIQQRVMGKRVFYG